jgi:hypothetical protein
MCASPHVLPHWFLMKMWGIQKIHEYCFYQTNISEIPGRNVQNHVDLSDMTLSIRSATDTLELAKKVWKLTKNREATFQVMELYSWHRDMASYAFGNLYGRLECLPEPPPLRFHYRKHRNALHTT